MSKTVHEFKIADFDTGSRQLAISTIQESGDSLYYCYMDSAIPRIIDSGGLIFYYGYLCKVEAKIAKALTVV